MGSEITWLLPRSSRSACRVGLFWMAHFRRSREKQPTSTPLFARSVFTLGRSTFWIDRCEHCDAGNRLTVDLGRDTRTWPLHRPGNTRERLIATTIFIVCNSPLYGFRGACG